MGMRKVYTTTYSFKKPNLLTEIEFNKLKSGLPIYPQSINVNKEMFKEYWGYIFCLFPPIFCAVIVLEFLSKGYIEPLRYRKFLVDKNQYYIKYYNSIYQSKTFNEYCLKNKDLY